MDELLKNIDWLIPKELNVVNIDWEKERKRLPERYVACAYRGLLDHHSYLPHEHSAMAKSKERSAKSYELTKRKARKMLSRLPGKFVQVSHGDSGEIDPKTGLPNATVGKCVIGEIIQGWLENNDEDLYTEFKLDNNDDTSLMWNYLIHHSKVNRGVSLNTGSSYTESYPLELSLVHDGVRPGTGITDVITKDGKRIKFELYKLETDNIDTTSVVSSPSSSPPQAVASPSPPQSTDIEMDRQRDEKGHFVPIGSVTGEGASQMAAKLQHELAHRQQQQQQPQYSNPTNTPGTFTSPMAPNPKYQNTQMEYSASQDFTGMPHTNMFGGMMHDIAVDQHASYLQKQHQQRQQQAANEQLMQTPATAIQPARTYVPQNPPEVANPLQPDNNNQTAALQAQIKQLQAQQQAMIADQQAQRQAAAAAAAVKNTDSESSIHAKTVGYDHDAGAPKKETPLQGDTKMTDSDQEEDDHAVSEWRQNANEKEIQQVRASAEEKLLNGRARELTKKESLILGEDKVQSKKQLKKKDVDQKNTKDTIVAALMSLKPASGFTDIENNAIENIKRSNDMHEIRHNENIVIAAAGARMVNLTTQQRIREEYEQQQAQAKRQRLQNNPLQQRFNQLSRENDELNRGQMTPSAVQSYNNGYDPRTQSYGSDYAPTSSPAPAPVQQQQLQIPHQYQQQQQQQRYQPPVPPPSDSYNNGPRIPPHIRYLADIDQHEQYFQAVKHHRLPPTMRNYDFDPTGVSDIILQPAGSYHAHGTSKKRGADGSTVETQPEIVSNPKTNTRNEMEWLHKVVLPERTRQSFLENGYKEAHQEWEKVGYAVDNFPMRRIMPKVADHITNTYAQQQQMEQLTMMQQQGADGMSHSSGMSMDNGGAMIKSRFPQRSNRF